MYLSQACGIYLGFHVFVLILMFTFDNSVYFVRHSKFRHIFYRLSEDRYLHLCCFYFQITLKMSGDFILTNQKTFE